MIYSSATQGITVDLAAGTASGPEIGNDTLISIENVVGGSGNDIIHGDAGDNQLFGGDGDDLLTGVAAGLTCSMAATASIASASRRRRVR